MQLLQLSRSAVARLLISGIALNCAAILFSIITFAIETPPILGYLTGFTLIATLVFGFIQTYVNNGLLNRGDPRGRLLNAGDYAYLLYTGIFLVCTMVLNLLDTVAAFLQLVLLGWGIFALMQGEFLLRLLLNVIAWRSLGGSAFLGLGSASSTPLSVVPGYRNNLLKRLGKTLIFLLVWAVMIALMLFVHPLINGGIPGDVGAVACIISGIGYCFFIFLGASNAMLANKVVARKAHPRLWWFLMISNVSLAGFYTTPFFAMPGALTDADNQFAATFGSNWNVFPAGVASQFQPVPTTVGSIFFGYHGREDCQSAIHVSYCNGSGYQLYFDVYYPNGPNQGIGHNATIIFIHGGAWWMGSLGMSAKELKYLASQGYVCFDIEYRLMDPHYLNAQAEQGPNLIADFLSLTGGPSYLSGNYTIGDMVEDVGNFTHYLTAPGTNLYGADLSNTIIIGQSAGAHLAAIAAYGWNDPYFGTNFSTAGITLKAVILHYPPNNASEFFYYNHPMFHSDSFSIIPGTPITNPGVYYKYTPSNLITGSAPPTLIYQGTSDMMVPPTNAQAIHDQMTAHGRPCIEVLGPFGGHAFDFAPHYSAVIIYYTERFLYRILN